jgi:hypothetical protein
MGFVYVASKQDLNLITPTFSLGGNAVNVTNAELVIPKRLPLFTGPITWKVLVILFQHFDYTYAVGGHGRVKGSVSDGVIATTATIFSELPDQADFCSSGRIQMTVDFMVPTRTLDNDWMSYENGQYRTINIETVQPEIKTFPYGKYDTVIGVWATTTDGINFSPLGEDEWGSAALIFPEAPNKEWLFTEPQIQVDGRWVTRITRGGSTKYFSNVSKGATFVQIIYPWFPGVPERNQFPQVNWGSTERGEGVNVALHEITHHILAYYNEIRWTIGTLPDLMDTHSLDTPVLFGFEQGEGSNEWLSAILSGTLQKDGVIIGVTPELLALGTPTDPRAEYNVYKLTYEPASPVADNDLRHFPPPIGSEVDMLPRQS